VNKKIFLTLLLSLALVVPCWGQEPGSEVPTKDETVGEISTKSVRWLLNDFLSRKGLSKGSNKGGKLYVMTGTSEIKVKPGNPGYMNSRTIAFDQAMFDAKRKLIQKFSAEIRSSLESSFARTSGEKKSDFEDTKPPKAPTLLDKGVKLAHAKLDRMLKEEGVDPTSEKGAQQAKKLIASSKFKAVTEVAAESHIYGMYPVATFESQNKIGVVAMISDNSKNMATALYNSLAGIETAKRKRPKKPISEYIPQDPEKLLMTFGVKQVIDENGVMWLLAFGQAEQPGDYPGAEEIAVEEAETESQGLMRQFAGEVVSANKRREKAERMAAFDDRSQKVGDFSSYMTNIKSVSEAKVISGLEEAYVDVVQHPITGQKAAVYVGKWSPLSASEANTMRNDIGRGPAEVRGGGSGTTSGDKGGLSGGGMEVDEDSF
jgi:hypothetical protein